MTDDIRHKARAAFLAAIMVLSVVAMTASFGGAAVAQTVDDPDEGDIAVDSFTITNNNQSLLSEEVKYTNNFADNNNVGPVLGVPIQTGAYDSVEPTNTVSYDADLDYVANNTESSQTVVVEYDDATDSGLVLNESLSSINNSALDSSSNVTVNNNVGELIIENESTGGSNNVNVHKDLNLTFEVEDEREGLSLDGALDELVIRAVGSDGTSERDSILAFESGPTGIDYADAANFNNTEQIDASIAPDGDGAFGQFVGSQILVQAPADEDTVEVYEADTNDDDEYVLGDRVLTSDTAPSNTSTIDTADLGAGEYFIGFNESEAITDSVFLDLRNLNLEASADSQVTTEETLEIEVTSDEADAIRATGDVEAWIWEEGDDAVDDVIHVEEGNLLGVTGDTTLEIDPTEELNGDGEYYATVLHNDSELTATTDTFEVIEPRDEEVQITAPTPGEEQYTRGDIVEISATLENTQEATITLGDRESGQNFELNITVRDANEDGEVNFLINTFQLGDGEASGNVTYDGSTIAGDDWGNKTHGVRTLDEDDTTIVDVNAHNGSLQIGGGSNAVDNRTVVIAEGTYDIVASPGDVPAKDSRATDRSNLNLDPRSTSEDVTAWQAPADGDPAEVEDIQFVGGIQTAIENNVVTPQEGSHADGDFLILQVESSGLEGILANEVEQNDDIDMDLEEFLNREENHEVTEPFTQSDLISISSEQTVEDVGEAIQDAFEDDQRNVPRDTTFGLPASIQLLGQEEQAVIADTDEYGNLEEYFVLTPVDEDTIIDNSTSDNVPLSRDLADLDNGTIADLIEVHPNLDDLTVAEAYTFFRDNNESEIDTVDLPTDFQTQFELQAGVNDEVAGNFPLNDLFDEGIDATLNWTLNDDVVDLDRLEDGTLTLPPREDVAVTGTTNIASSTTLEHVTQSASGEDPPFFDANEFQVEYVEDGDNEFSFNLSTTRPMIEHAGQEFSMEIYRLADNQLVTPNDEAIDGQISQPFEIYGHEFADQEAGGQAVTVDSVNVSDTATLQIQDADGNVLGEEDLVAGNNEDIGILLDEPISETQELDSVILDEGTEPDDDLARVTATYTVTDTAEADFSVSNLDPIADTVEPGTEVTVTADISNVGDAAGTKDVEFRLDGETIATQELSLDAGGSESVEFTETVEDAGEYTHSVWTEDDEAQGQLTVEEAEEPPANDTDDDTDNATDDDGGADDGGPGFGIAAALIAVIGAALLAYRRREA